MVDIAARLNSVKARIERLAELAAPEQEANAREMAAALKAELDSAIAEAGGMPPADDTTSPLPRGPRHEELRCPVCSLRSFRYQKGTMRRSATSDSGFEALFHCLSCGHEAWHEAQ